MPGSNRENLFSLASRQPCFPNHHKKQKDSEGISLELWLAILKLLRDLTHFVLAQLRPDTESGDNAKIKHDLSVIKRTLERLKTASVSPISATLTLTLEVHQLMLVIWCEKPRKDKDDLEKESGRVSLQANTNL